MNYKKVLFGIFAIIWTIGVLAQQIHWIHTGGYNTVAFIWAIIELCVLYLIFKVMED